MEFYLCLLIVYIVEAVIFLHYTFALFQLKYPRMVTIAATLSAYMLLFALSFIENIWINVGFIFIVNFVLLLVLFSTKGAASLFHSAILTTLMALSEIVIINITTHLPSDYFGEFSSLRDTIILSVFSKFLYYILVTIIAKFLSKNKQVPLSRDPIFFAVIIVSLFTTFVMITLVSIWRYSLLSVTQNYMIAISAVLLLCGNLIIYWIYDYNQGRNNEFTQLQLQLQKEEDIAEYNNILLEQDENQKILIHDIRKHLQSIATLNKENQQDMIADYIDHLIHSSDFQTIATVCKNPFLNSLLCRYKRQCKHHQIDLRIDIRKDSIDFLTDEDMTSLFCNLLDNAIVAAKKCSNSYIEVTASKKNSTAPCVITVINSCGTNPFSADGKLISTRKRDRLLHGIGLRSIRKVVEKYHGDLEMYYNKETRTFHSIIALGVHKQKAL